MITYRGIAFIASVCTTAACIAEMRKLKVYPTATYVIEFIYRILAAAWFCRMFP